MSRILNMCFLLAATPAFAVADMAAKEVTAVLTNAKTIGTLVEHLKLDKATSTFLREKIKGLENSPIQIEETGALKFRIRMASLIVPFEIHEYKLDGVVEIEINRHTVRSKLGEKPEVLWEKISGALPKAAAHWSPFSTAYAGEGFAQAIRMLVMSAAAQGAAEMILGKNVCKQYDDYLSTCPNGSEFRLEKIATFSLSWDGNINALGCKDIYNRVRECAQKRAKELHYTPPPELSSYFDLKAPGTMVNHPDGTIAN